MSRDGYAGHHGNKELAPEVEARLDREARGSDNRETADRRANAIEGSTKLLERLQEHHGHNE